MKKGDKVQVWDSKNFIPIGCGIVIGIGVGAKKGVPLVEVEDNLIWANEYHCIPEQKAFEITKRIERDLR